MVESKKKRKLHVMKLAPTILINWFIAQKKSTIGMYFNHGKQPFIDLTSFSTLSNPISLDLSLEELKFCAISINVITMSNDTLPAP